MGISVLSEHTLNSDSKQSELSILDVEYFPIKRRWYVAHLAGKQLSIIAQTFLEYLLEESKKIPISSTNFTKTT
jgi:DNA-binding transcriptional LysR family regulator